MSQPVEFEVIASKARQLIAEQGLTPEVIDPAIVVLATNNPKHTEDAAWEFRMSRLRTLNVNEARDRSEERGSQLSFSSVYESELAYLDKEYSADDLALSDSVRQVAERLRAPSRRRGRVRMLIGGIAAGSAILLALGHSLANNNDERIAAGEQRAPGTPDRIIEAFALVPDPSIWPEDSGPDVPIIGSVIAHIPGVPDFEPELYKVTYHETKTVETKETTIESQYTASEVQNPVAPDLKLTGPEYLQGRAAAKEFFSKLPKGAILTELSVTSLVSDELNCEVGEPNLEQNGLIRDRAAVAAQALYDESLEAGVTLPAGVDSAERITQSGHEVVLTAEEVRELDHLLAGSDSCIAQASYNNGTLSEGPLKAFLSQKLGSNRGARFTGIANYSVESVQTTTELVKNDRPVVLSGLQGELFFFSYAGLVIMYSVVLGTSRKRPRAVQKEAIKEARQAGLEI